MSEHRSNNGAPIDEDRGVIVQKNQHTASLEVRSTEVQEIIGRPPHWLVRGGIGVFLGVIVLIFVAASTIEYPESVQASVKLHAAEPRSGDASYYGEISIPESSISKVEEGQTVLVRFTSYPSQEYGSVKAQIGYISDVIGNEGKILGKVNFPDGLTTNYGYQIDPIDGMTGQAEIITKDMKLLERIYNNLTGRLR